MFLLVQRRSVSIQTLKFLMLLVNVVVVKFQVVRTDSFIFPWVLILTMIPIDPQFASFDFEILNQHLKNAIVIAQQFAADLV